MWILFSVVGKFLTKMFLGGSLDTILESIDNRVSDETTRAQIQADVTKTVVTAQANLMVGRTWWFQLLFIIPLGIWWSAIILDSIFQFPNWSVAALPHPLDDWAAYMISGLFIVDGGKSLIGRFTGGK